MNYSELSDFEINKLVAEALGYFVQEEYEKHLGFTEEFHKQYPDTIWVQKGKNHYIEQACFTSDPSDAWPLILEHNISLLKPHNSSVGPEWEAVAGGYHGYDGFEGGDYYHEHTNPLRAAAIVYLMIKEGES